MAAGVEGMTLSEVKGFGRQKGSQRNLSRHRVHGRFSAENKIRDGGSGRSRAARRRSDLARGEDGKIGDGKILLRKWKRRCVSER